MIFLPLAVIYTFTFPIPFCLESILLLLPVNKSRMDLDHVT